MNIVGRLLGILVLCWIVGMFLAFLGITPQSIFIDTWGTIVSVVLMLVDLVRWALPYVLLGAIIVVPIVLLNLIRGFSRRR